MLSSCNKEKEIHETGVASRTLLVYMVAENSLADYADLDIQEILRGNEQMHDNDRIVIYLDALSAPAIYVITNKTEGSSINDLTPVYKYENDINSCSKEALTNFLTYVRNNTESNTYAMVLWSHGSGWIPSSYPYDDQSFTKLRSFAVDNNSNKYSDYGNQMSISSLHGALASFGQKFDYLFFDCCFMQSIEVGYELRDIADYIIASPAEIPGPGADYNIMLPAFFDKVSYPQSIPESYYTAYSNNSNYGVLISTLRTSELDNLAEATHDIIKRHGDEILSMSYDSVLNYFPYNRFRRFAVYPDFYEMNGIFRKLLTDDEYQVWHQAFKYAVPYSYATSFWISRHEKSNFEGKMYVDFDQWGGMSMYIPLDKYNDYPYAGSNKFFVNGYLQSQWANAIWSNI